MTRGPAMSLITAAFHSFVAVHSVAETAQPPNNPFVYFQDSDENPSETLLGHTTTNLNNAV